MTRCGCSSVDGCQCYFSGGSSYSISGAGTEADPFVISPIFGQDTVATSETTTSVPFTDLATPGPEVELTTGVAALVVINGVLSNAGGFALIGVEVSGASSIAATDTRSLQWTGAGAWRGSAMYLIEGLTPGVNIFTLKYRVDAGTGTFTQRNLVVIPQ